MYKIFVANVLYKCIVSPMNCGLVPCLCGCGRDATAQVETGNTFALATCRKRFQARAKAAGQSADELEQIFRLSSGMSRHIPPPYMVSDEIAVWRNSRADTWKPQHSRDLKNILGDRQTKIPAWMRESIRAATQKALTT